MAQHRDARPRNQSRRRPWNQCISSNSHVTGAYEAAQAMVEPFVDTWIPHLASLLVTVAIPAKRDVQLYHKESMIIDGQRGTSVEMSDLLVAEASTNTIRRYVPEHQTYVLSLVSPPATAPLRTKWW